MLQSSWQAPAINHTLFKESIMCIYYITGTCLLGILLLFLHKVCNLQGRGETTFRFDSINGTRKFTRKLYTLSFIVGFYDFVVR